MRYTIAIALLLCLVAEDASGDMFNIPCGDYDEGSKLLKEKYNEAVITGGIASGNAGVIEIWSSPDGSTFTIMFRDSNGRSCSLGAGTDWGAVNPQPQGEPL